MISGDTIAAIATAPGRGGVAVVRVSGPDALSIAGRLTGRGEELRAGIEGRGGKPIVLHSPFFALGSVIDEGLLLAFMGPRSYTGEDVVEFQCHGGTVTPRRVLEACFAAGARLARRGEFTERAFLGGKLGYDQAESVLALVDAKTERAADAALAGLEGRRARTCRSLYGQAIDLSARIEHALDVDEGELPAGFLPSVAAAVSSLASALRAAIAKAAEDRLLREGVLVVLAGPPNAGKSSLLNALLEDDRAIVSDVPGTTRDAIEAWIDLDGWPVRLVDTAGLRETADEVEGEGVRRTEGLLAKAELVLWLGEASDVSRLPSPALGLHAKCDLGRGEGLNVSAKTGEGLEELRRAIVARLEARVAAADEGEATGGDVAAFHEALALLGGAGNWLGDGAAVREDGLVLLANVVRGVAERLGAAIGATYSQDMLDNLFSRFCVGK